MGSCLTGLGSFMFLYNQSKHSPMVMLAAGQDTELAKKLSLVLIELAEYDKGLVNNTMLWRQIRRLSRLELAKLIQASHYINRQLAVRLMEEIESCLKKVN